MESTSTISPPDDRRWQTQFLLGRPWEQPYESVFQMPFHARIGLLILAFLVLSGGMIMVGIHGAEYTGPPITVRFNVPNPRGDYEFEQRAPVYNPHAPMAGRHPSIIWNEFYQRLVLCVPVHANGYANEADARAGILMEPGKDYFYPKGGSRGCWHPIGFVPVTTVVPPPMVKR